ncbi:hypothetical protein OAT11_03550 [Nitrospinaceae bacterium]|nr:hypothetical protein [Nitrospinaceae bacterium]
MNPLAPNKNIEKGRKLFSEEANRPYARSVMGARGVPMAALQGG